MTSLPILYGPERPDLLRHEILADLFEATAARLPHKTALIAAAGHLSYAELNAAADLAAHRLMAAGVRPGDMVGLWLPRGLELLVCQLAIAKTGAAWLPFDAEVPPERIAVCLQDASAKALVISELFAPVLQGQDGILAHILTAPDLLAPLPEGSRLQRRQGASPEQPAYVIYTSGSTGKPKGIAVTQGSICHFLRSENARLGVREDDRVYQGFSVAFDMSFEEIWISYLVGATLWLAPKEIAGDPEALPLALIENDISVLHAVPTLLALFAQDVPGLRIINLGGEMCPQSLVDQWARPGRQMFNTYGPTEATVSASLAELHAGEPVTIGEALPNYGLLVIAPIEQDSIAGGVLPPLQLLPFGDTGELCITGPGVAAGYLGRPELTAEKFVPNPWARSAQEARLYRTGDLARVEWKADGTPQMQCLGRADDQVKVRGFRVELGEIEAVLAAQPGVGTTAVVLRPDGGMDQLIAFYVPSDRPPEAKALRQALADKLPPYMLPARFEPLPAMPRLPSGKIDRKTLKSQPLAAAAPSADGDTPETPAEALLFAALQTLFPGQPIRREQDFFSDLGGHSLLAARLTSALRRDARFAQATVSDIYTHRRVGSIAQVLQAGMLAGTSQAERPFLLHSPWRRWRCGLAQGAAIPLLVLLNMAQWLAPFFVYHFYTGDPGDSIVLAVAMSVLAFLGSTLLGFAVACAGRWLLAGRLAPGSYPLWGLTYYRWWLADRLTEVMPLYLLNGSVLYPAWLRLLGARIGPEVVLGSTTMRVPHLVTIGAGTSIGNGVNLENARVEGGRLHLARIHIGAHCGIGSYVVIEGDTAIGDWGHVEGQSALLAGQRVPGGKVWHGSPARERGDFDPASLRPRPPVPATRQGLEAAFYALGALIVAVLFFMPVFPTFMLIDWLDVPEIAVRPLVDDGSLTAWQAFGLRLVKFFVLALPASMVFILATVLLSALIRWAFLPRMRAGSWPIHSVRYLAKWLVNLIQEASLAVLHGLYATVYSAAWYRLLGARVGKETELSTALGVVPDMLTLGDGCFIADAVMLGDEHIDGGWMTVQPTVVSRRSFVGNGAYVPDGTTVPENTLIGVLGSVPRNAAMQPGDTWLGSPPIKLPAREVVAGFPEHLTFAPSPWRKLARGAVEAFRIAAPHALVIAAGYAIVLDAMPLAEEERWAAVALDLAVGGLLFGMATFAFVALFKWLAVRRYGQRAVPMWTPFVWLSEAATNLYEGVAVPWFLRYLRGTPWLNDALKLLGADIGRGVYLDTTDMTEFDCVHIGAHSELNALCCPQTHLFEDRVMKIDHVRIGSRVTLGPRCTVLYGAQVGDGAQLAALTLVMKGEQIPAGTRWHGLPAAPWR